MTDTQKIALVTGASRGLGAALALELSKTHHVVAVGRTTGALEELDDRIQANGGQATLAHITLRITDLPAARELCENKLGMRLMSIQPVQERNFSLYFYAWSDEPLPNPDLEAVENREWLWARPYALLELQHPIRNTTIAPFQTDRDPREGDRIGVVSYATGDVDAPELQERCKVLSRQAGVVVMSCQVDFGASGAPVFSFESGTPRIVSVVSAKAEAQASS